MRATLLKVSAHIRTFVTRGREVPPSADKQRVPKGYWQTSAWLYKLWGLGYEAERVASQPGSSS